MDAYEHVKMEFVPVYLRMDNITEVSRVMDALQQYADKYGIGYIDPIHDTIEKLRRMYDARKLQRGVTND